MGSINIILNRKWLADNMTAFGEAYDKIADDSTKGKHLLIQMPDMAQDNSNFEVKQEGLAFSLSLQNPNEENDTLAYANIGYDLGVAEKIDFVTMAIGTLERYRAVLAALAQKGD